MISNMNICVVCDKEIPEARLKILPDTNLCSAKCVETTKDKIEIIANNGTVVIKKFDLIKLVN